MRNKLTSELAVCGFNAVCALGKEHPEKINRLFLREDRLPDFTKLCKKLAERKRPYKLCEDEELEKICKSSRHQGVVAMIYEPIILPITKEEVLRWANEGNYGVILDDVGNDNNLGSIIRAAAFFGANPVIVSHTDKKARVTTSAYRVAEGGMEYVTLRQVHSIQTFLQEAGKELFTIGADHHAHQRLEDLKTIIADKKNEVYQKKEDTKLGIALIVGNEEKGLNVEVKNMCSVVVRIPGTGNIESLNVAQAASLFLHQLYVYS